MPERDKPAEEEEMRGRQGQAVSGYGGSGNADDKEKKELVAQMMRELRSLLSQLSSATSVEEKKALLSRIEGVGSEIEQLTQDSSIVATVESAKSSAAKAVENAIQTETNQQSAADIEARRNELSNRIAEIDKRLDQLSKRSKEIEKELGDIAKQRVQNQREQEDLRKQLERETDPEKRKEIEKTLEENRRYQEYLDQKEKRLQKEKEAVEKETVRLHHHKEGLHKEKEALDRAVAQVDYRATGLHKEKDAVEKETVRLHHHKEGLHKEKEALDRAVAQVDYRATGLHKEKDAVEKETARLSQHKESLHKEKEALDRAVTQVDLREARLHKDTEALDKEIARLHQNRRGFEHEQQALEKEKTNIAQSTQQTLVKLQGTEKARENVAGARTNVKSEHKDVVNKDTKAMEHVKAITDVVSTDRTKVEASKAKLQELDRELAQVAVPIVAKDVTTSMSGISDVGKHTDTISATVNKAETIPTSIFIAQTEPNTQQQEQQQAPSLKISRFAKPKPAQSANLGEHTQTAITSATSYEASLAPETVQKERREFPQPSAEKITRFAKRAPVPNFPSSPPATPHSPQHSRDKGVDQNKGPSGGRG